MESTQVWGCTSDSTTYEQWNLGKHFVSLSYLNCKTGLCSHPSV